jgi:hypothetical protein
MSFMVYVLRLELSDAPLIRHRVAFRVESFLTLVRVKTLSPERRYFLFCVFQTPSQIQTISSANSTIETWKLNISRLGTKRVGDNDLGILKVLSYCLYFGQLIYLFYGGDLV